MYGIIYRISFKNSESGKIYIGQTTQKLSRRISQHCPRFSEEKKHNRPLVNAINKYGLENMLVDVLDNAANDPELDEKEKYWIKELNSLAPNGYNLTPGGKDKEHYQYMQKRKTELETEEQKKIRIENTKKGKATKLASDPNYYKKIAEKAKIVREEKKKLDPEHYSKIQKAANQKGK